MSFHDSRRNPGLIHNACVLQCLSDVLADVMVILNAFHAAGECRRQVKNLTNLVKNGKIVEFHVHIWIHHKKCIQISTNIPGIGSVNREITVKTTILLSKTNDRVRSIKIFQLCSSSLMI